MKKTILALLMVLLSVITMAAQTSSVTYTPSSGNIPNPERGFYHLLATRGSSSPVGTYNLLSTSTLNSYKTNEGITTIQREFYINDYINAAHIDQSYLTKMQQDFTSLRNAGMKAIIRFAYSKVESTTAVQQPTKANILNHISDVAPVINQNKDVIVCVQAGFIGTWGEWYYTNSTEFGSSDYENWNTTQWNNRNQVLTAMETQFDSSLPLQVRYIYILDKLRPQGTSRIGIYNDAFLYKWGDSGTFFVTSSTGTNTTQQNFLKNHTVSLPMSGETCGTNTPRTNCSGAMTEMNSYNWSLLNKDYYVPNITNWTTNGCINTITNSLGYRFQLINSSVSNGQLTITLSNKGYAGVFKNRPCYLVAKELNTGTKYQFLMVDNIKDWKKSQSIVLTKSLSGLSLPNGVYNLFLLLSDPSNSNKSYNIQLANNNTWNSTDGTNDLFQTIMYNNLSVVPFSLNGDLSAFNIQSIYVYDIYGKLVCSNINCVNTLPSGVYIVKLGNSTFKTFKN